MRRIRAVWKIFLVCLILLGFFIHSVFFKLYGFGLKILGALFPAQNERLQQRSRKPIHTIRQRRTAQKYCGLILKALNIKISFLGTAPGKKENFLIVCNHLSYLDGFILYSFLDKPCFIIAKDILKLRYLGFLLRYAEGYGVERKNKTKLKKDISVIQSLLNEEQNIVLFPEGSIGDGKALKRFKASFFESAVLAKKRVLPLCINYLSINSRPLNKENKNIIFWGRGYPILRHFFRFCQSRQIECEVTFGSPLSSQKTNRKELSTAAFNQISEKLKSIYKFNNKTYKLINF